MMINSIKILFLFLFLLCCGLVPAADAAALTAEQMELLKTLPSSQKKAMAEEYGLSMPESEETNTVPTEDESILPVVISPEEEEESSSVERNFIRMRTEKEIRDEDSDEFRNPFRNFVEDSRAVTVSTDIRQFGYDLFSGTPATFAPVTAIPVPRDYLIGPGDEILVDLYGANQEKRSLFVSRDGNISLGGEGPLQVAGLTFSKMSSLIENIVKQKMIGYTAYVTMGKLRSIRVFVLGDAQRPGSYTVGGLSTLSHALFVSGGIRKIGSLRNIELRRSGKKVASMDLYDFLLKGDTSGDMRIMPDDVIFIPPTGANVGIAGEVKRPAIYELRGETSVNELILMSGGMLPTAFRSFAHLERINAEGERITIDLDLKNSGGTTLLKDGDLLKIFPVLDRDEKVVHLIGNIRWPGKRSYQTGMKVSDLLANKDDLLPETFFDFAVIEREAEDNSEPEIIRFNLGGVFSGRSESDMPLKPRDKIYVFNRSHFRQTPMAEIEGLVKSPGSYRLKKDMQVIDLILAAGGLLRDSETKFAELYRTDPVSKEVTVRYIDLDKLLRGDDDEKIALQDLDKLVIHSVWESQSRKVVSVSGQVNNQGTYPLADKATIRDLLYAGGLFTEKAYRKEADLTRYTVVNGEKREANNIVIDLEKALSGDASANLELRPYDHLYVKEITNWRATERVTITGEVRFPGEYPVEEGKTLSSLIERAGGFTSKAYLFGGRFTRRAIAEYQKKQYNEMADRLETNIVTLSTEGAREDVEKKKLSIDALTSYVKKLRETEPDGRLVINLMKIDDLRQSSFDLILRDGDAIHVPKKADSVLVMGEVYNSNALLYTEGDKPSDYIDRAGGITALGNKDDIYVVKANGSVTPAKRGLFRSSPEITPGDVIVVPEKIRKLSALELTKDITQIIYQLGLAAASFHAIGVFN